MVSVTHTISGARAASVEQWLATLAPHFAAAELDVLEQACTLAAPLYEGKAELTGAPLLQHAKGAASILAGMNMDHETLAAAVLHAVPACQDDWAELLGERFGANVRELVEGISRMEQIRQFSEMHSQQQKEGKKAD